MNVLSVFDGISAGRLALQRAGIEVNKYYRSEIDKYASQVAMHHFPNDIQLGDVTKWREWNIDWSSIDLFIGGSPCQGFSFAGKQAGTKAVLNGEEILVTDRETYIELKDKGVEFLSQSHLFWEYVLILDHIKKHNPSVKFLLENVKMKKELLQMISDALGVKDVVINSSLVSAQNRHRHYWANWEITQPEDKGILLRDILEDVTPPEFNISGEAIAYMSKEGKGWTQNGKTRFEHNHNPLNGKAKTLTSNMYKGVPYGVIGINKAVKVTNINPSGNGMNGNVYHVDAKSPTLTTNKGEGIKITGGAIRNGSNTIVYRTCERIKEGNAGHIANATDIRGMDCIKRVYGQDGKAPTLTTMGGGHREPKVSTGEITYRKLTPTECARLQTFPDGWCESIVSKSQAYKAYGNSWTVDVIAHIFKDMLNDTTAA